MFSRGSASIRSSPLLPAPSGVTQAWLLSFWHWAFRCAPHQPFTYLAQAPAWPCIPLSPILTLALILTLAKHVPPAPTLIRGL